MASESVTPTSSIAYLGPLGTFSEQALCSQPDLAQANLVAMGSFADILFATAEGTVDYGFVAVENAIEGAVNVTLDTLAFDVDLSIQREVVLPIEMNLMVKPGTPLSDIKIVSSFPHAHAQTRNWLRDNLPEAEFIATTSTSEAARLVAEGPDTGVGAIGNSRAAEVFDLEILARDIAIHSDNATRFVLVGRDHIPAPSGHDKTSIVIFQRADEPGSLLAILQEFAARGINLTLLLSRPTRTALGDYCFVIDLEGHINSEVVAHCLQRLKATQADVRFLGSYPSAGDDNQQRRHSANESQADAERWMSDLRNRVGV